MTNNKLTYILYILALLPSSIIASETIINSENYIALNNTSSDNIASLAGINTDLTFKSGNYLLATNNGIVEVDLVQNSFEIFNDSTASNSHLRKKDSDIFLLRENTDTISHLDINTEILSTLSENISGKKFDIAGNRLIVAKDDFCGGHYIVYTSTGNAFSSNDECENRWESIITDENNILVSQNTVQTIRDSNAPSFPVSTLNDTGNIFLKDIDGGYWLFYANGIINKYNSNFNLIATYTTGLSIKHASIRADGLIVAEEYNQIHMLKPDHFFHREISASLYSNGGSGTFIKGIIVDEDKDNMPFWFETFYGLDPESNLDAALDSDGDNLTNYEEFLNKTYPDDADTDNDGLDDGIEMNIGTDPHNPDSDGDGLTDGLEYTDLNSNPLSTDSDGDGINDFTEFQFGLDINVSNVGVDTDMDRIDDIDELNMGTSPINEDSDSDDLHDGDEIDENTNPLNPDTDGDDLNDGLEISLNTNPLNVDSDNDTIEDGLEVNDLNSNPLSSDTENDQMPDGWEYQYGLDLLTNDSAGDLDLDNLSNLNEFLFGGNPTIKDTDRDGLEDGEEYILTSSITNRDTDGDNMPDGWEFLNSTNLLLADANIDNDLDTFNNGIEYWNKTNANDDTDYPTPQKWSTFQGNVKHTGYQPTDFVSYAVNPINSIILNDENLGQLNPASMNNDYILVSYTNNLVAIDRETNLESWRKVFQVNSTNPPSLDGDFVYIQTGNHSSATHLRSYEIESGQLNFQSPHGAQWESYLAPTIDEDTVYVNGGQYGGAYAFDKITGDQKWFANSFDQFDMWTPSLDNDYAYGYTYGNLIAVDKNTGVFEYSLDDPSYDWHGYSTNRAVIIGGYDTAIVSDNQNNTGNITVFDRFTREILWTKILDYKEQIVASNGVLYTQSMSDVLYALEERSGNVLWNYTLKLGDNFRYNLIVTNDYIIASGINQTYFININSHDVDFVIPFSGDKELSENNELLMTSNNGEIKVFKLQQDEIFDNSFEQALN